MVLTLVRVVTANIELLCGDSVKTALNVFLIILIDVCERVKIETSVEITKLNGSLSVYFFEYSIKYKSAFNNFLKNL